MEVTRPDYLGQLVSLMMFKFLIITRTLATYGLEFLGRQFDAWDRLRAMRALIV